MRLELSHFPASPHSYTDDEAQALKDRGAFGRMCCNNDYGAAAADERSKLETGYLHHKSSEDGVITAETCVKLR